MMSSPRAWGCFRHYADAGNLRAVFPTCVGVFLWTPVADMMLTGLPHVRGGVSFVICLRSYMIQSSPRAWGCFPKPYSPSFTSDVFPTCVGVFLLPGVQKEPDVCLPHVRGGVST